jgi:cyanophycin synthetase
LAAETFDELVIREGKIRGRAPGEVPDLLRAAAVSSGLAPDKIQVILDERQAVETAIAHGGPDDLVVVMVDSGRIEWLWRVPTRDEFADDSV